MSRLWQELGDWGGNLWKRVFSPRVAVDKSSVDSGISQADLRLREEELRDIEHRIRVLEASLQYEPGGSDRQDSAREVSAKLAALKAEEMPEPQLKAALRDWPWPLVELVRGKRESERAYRFRSEWLKASLPVEVELIERFDPDAKWPQFFRAPEQNGMPFTLDEWEKKIADAAKAKNDWSYVGNCVLADAMERLGPVFVYALATEMPRDRYGGIVRYAYGEFREPFRVDFDLQVALRQLQEFDSSGLEEIDLVARYCSSFETELRGEEAPRISSLALSLLLAARVRGNGFPPPYQGSGGFAFEWSMFVGYLASLHLGGGEMKMTIRCVGMSGYLGSFEEEALSAGFRRGRRRGLAGNTPDARILEMAQGSVLLLLPSFDSENQLRLTDLNQEQKGRSAKQTFLDRLYRLEFTRRVPGMIVTPWLLEVCEGVSGHFDYQMLVVHPDAVQEMNAPEHGLPRWSALLKTSFDRAVLLRRGQEKSEGDRAAELTLLKQLSSRSPHSVAVALNEEPLESLSSERLWELMAHGEPKLIENNPPPAGIH